MDGLGYHRRSFAPCSGFQVPLDETRVEFDEDKIDRIELFYEDSPEATIRATVNRLLSDRDEGMGLV